MRGRSVMNELLFGVLAQQVPSIIITLLFTHSFNPFPPTITHQPPSPLPIIPYLLPLIFPTKLNNPTMANEILTRPEIRFPSIRLPINA